MLQESISSFENLRFRSGASTRILISPYDSVREYQPGVSYLPTIPFGSINPKSRISLSFPTIPFGSINPKSRIFLRFRSGISTRSLVSSYDSVRERQPEVSYFSFLSYDSVREYQSGVSYFPTIPFGIINLESRIFLTISFKKYDNI